MALEGQQGGHSWEGTSISWLHPKHPPRAGLGELCQPLADIQEQLSPHATAKRFSICIVRICVTKANLLLNEVSLRSSLSLHRKDQ